MDLSLFQAKEKELEEIEELLSGVSHAKLQQYQELHSNPGETDSE